MNAVHHSTRRTTRSSPLGRLPTTTTGKALPPNTAQYPNRRGWVKRSGPTADIDCDCSLARPIRSTGCISPRRMGEAKRNPSSRRRRAVRWLAEPGGSQNSNERVGNLLPTRFISNKQRTAGCLMATLQSAMAHETRLPDAGGSQRSRNWRQAQSPAPRILHPSPDGRSKAPCPSSPTWKCSTPSYTLPTEPRTRTKYEEGARMVPGPRLPLTASRRATSALDSISPELRWCVAVGGSQYRAQRAPHCQPAPLQDVGIDQMCSCTFDLSALVPQHSGGRRRARSDRGAAQGAGGGPWLSGCAWPPCSRSVCTPTAKLIASTPASGRSVTTCWPVAPKPSARRAWNVSAVVK